MPREAIRALLDENSKRRIDHFVLQQQFSASIVVSRFMWLALVLYLWWYDVVSLGFIIAVALLAIPMWEARRRQVEHLQLDLIAREREAEEARN